MKPIGFPHRRRGGLRQLFRMVPWGWEDLGMVQGKFMKETSRGNLYGWDACKLCRNIVRIGRETAVDGKKIVFLYCPICETKSE